VVTIAAILMWGTVNISCQTFVYDKHDYYIIAPLLGFYKHNFLETVSAKTNRLSNQS
jgi:hypothetical protein